MPRKRKFTKEDLKRLFKILHYDPYKKRWSNITEAAEKFKTTRQTITNYIKIAQKYGYIDEFGEFISVKPKKAKSAYLSAFEKTLAFEKGYKYAKFHKYKGPVIRAWRALRGKDPYYWDYDDCKLLREPEIEGKKNPLYNSITGDIREQDATAIREVLRLIRAENLKECIEALRFVTKVPAGRRLEWYLIDDEIIRLIDTCDNIHALMFMVLELQSGARPADALSIKKSDIVADPSIGKFIKYYDSKKKMIVPRFFTDNTFVLLDYYNAKFNIKYEDYIFKKLGKSKKNRLTKMREIIKRIGNKAGVQKVTARARGLYVFRHTFATQALNRNVPIDVVASQGGWKTTSVITDFYAKVNPIRMRKFLLSKQITIEPFSKWIEKLEKRWILKFKKLL